MTTKEWLKEHSYFKSFEEALEKGDIHVEETERDMKLWFLEDMDTEMILDIIEGNKNINYGNWDYLEDRNIWVFIYQ